MSVDIPEWLPDWRYPEDYPDPASMTPQHWAWEFLRRNTEYQKAYKEHCELVYNLGLPDDDSGAIYRELLEIERLNPYMSDKDFSSYEKFYWDLKNKIEESELRVRRRFTHLQGLKNDPFRLPCPSLKSDNWEFAPIDKKSKAYFYLPQFCDNEFSEYVTYVKNGEVVFDYELQKWVDALLEINKIEKESDGLILRKIDASTKVYTSSGPLTFQIDVHGNIRSSRSLTCTIDVHGNIQGQLDDIKNVALLQRKLLAEHGLLGSEPRDKVKDYNPYLRTYDAYWAGFTLAEVASEMFPEIENDYPNYLATKRVRNLLNRAKKLVESDYYRLASL